MTRLEPRLTQERVEPADVAGTDAVVKPSPAATPAATTPTPAATIKPQPKPVAAEVAYQRPLAMADQIEELGAQSTGRGLVVTLADKLFQNERPELKPSAAADIRRIARFLAQNPQRAVSIEGYTDNAGDRKQNLSLSQRRAAEVKDQLVAHGVDPARIYAAGMGDATPVAGNDSAAGRRANRRVEIVIRNTTTSSR